MIKQSLLLILVVVGISSCASSSPGLYSWYGYNSAAYSYMKSPDEKEGLALMAIYDQSIDKQRGTRGVVPPGIYAEKGYLLLKGLNYEEGLACLKKEVELYPESEIFLSKIISHYEDVKKLEDERLLDEIKESEDDNLEGVTTDNIQIEEE